MHPHARRHIRTEDESRVVRSTQAEYMREDAVKGATDVVYTMPTKPLAVTAAGASAPFRAALGNDGACELAREIPWSRDAVHPPRTENFPELSSALVAMLCWPVTVQSFTTHWPAASAVTGSHAGLRHKSFPSSEFFAYPVLYPNGVDEVGFDHSTFGLRPARVAPTSLVTDLVTGTQTRTAGAAYVGLPVVGVSMMRYTNGTLDVGGVRTLSNYGTGSALKTFREVTTP